MISELSIEGQSHKIKDAEARQQIHDLLYGKQLYDEDLEQLEAGNYWAAHTNQCKNTPDFDRTNFSFFLQVIPTNEDIGRRLILYTGRTINGQIWQKDFNYDTWSEWQRIDPYVFLVRENKDVQTIDGEIRPDVLRTNKAYIYDLELPSGWLDLSGAEPHIKTQYTLRMDAGGAGTIFNNNVYLDTHKLGFSQYSGAPVTPTLTIDANGISKQGYDGNYFFHANGGVVGLTTTWKMKDIVSISTPVEKPAYNFLAEETSSSSHYSISSDSYTDPKIQGLNTHTLSYKGTVMNNILLSVGFSISKSYSGAANGKFALYNSSAGDRYVKLSDIKTRNLAFKIGSAESSFAYAVNLVIDGEDVQPTANWNVENGMELVVFENVSSEVIVKVRRMVGIYEIIFTDEMYDGIYKNTYADSTWQFVGWGSSSSQRNAPSVENQLTSTVEPDKIYMNESQNITVTDAVGFTKSGQVAKIWSKYPVKFSNTKFKKAQYIEYLVTESGNYMYQLECMPVSSNGDCVIMIDAQVYEN